MELKDWEKQYDKLMEENIDLYLQENGADLVVPNLLRSKEYQLSEYKNQLKQLIYSNATADIIEQALTLVYNFMPKLVSKEIWEGINNEFSNCHVTIINFLKEDEQKSITTDQKIERKNSEDYTPIYKMCGLSLQTLTYCYKFGKLLYDKKKFSNSKSIMLFLMQIAPDFSEFWIAAGMCDKQLGKFQSAINIYKSAESAFPDNPLLYLYCADNCLVNGDSITAKAQLDIAKNLLEINSELNTQWQPTYEYLLAKVA